MDHSARYARQVRFASLGTAGQSRLGASSALICGCGALGSTIANWLVRAGVGRVRIVDRDFVDVTNLHRQSLFDEADAAAALPKAVAAAEKLRRVNSAVVVEAAIADILPDNIEQLAAGCDVLLDGTDNFETRYLINDLAVSSGRPWVFAGVVGADGQAMTIVPGQTPCLRCLMPDCPPPGSTPTCDTAGVLGPAVGVLASWQAGEALKLLAGQRESIPSQLTVFDLWAGQVRQVDLRHLREAADCPACIHGQFVWLGGQQSSRTDVLCGRNSVQLTLGELGVPLAALAERLQGLGTLTVNAFLLRLVIEGYEVTVFADGRAIVGGTTDPAVARTVYAKVVGN